MSSGTIDHYCEPEEIAVGETQNKCAEKKCIADLQYATCPGRALPSVSALTTMINTDPTSSHYCGCKGSSPSYGCVEL